MTDTVKLHLSWATITADALSLSFAVGLKGHWTGILAIARGGLIPAALLASQLNIRRVHTILAESYEGTQRRVLVARLQDSIGTLDVKSGSGWLLVDDLVDSGQTAKVIREMVPQAHFACLYAKPAGAPLADTYIRAYEQHEWIVFPWEAE